LGIKKLLSSGIITIKKKEKTVCKSVWRKHPIDSNAIIMPKKTIAM